MHTNTYIPLRSPRNRTISKSLVVGSKRSKIIRSWRILLQLHNHASSFPMSALRYLRTIARPPISCGTDSENLISA
jgi:hypothetical protein